MLYHKILDYVIVRVTREMIVKIHKDVLIDMLYIIVRVTREMAVKKHEYILIEIRYAI